MHPATAAADGPLLTRVAAPAAASGSTSKPAGEVPCVVPNEFARTSLRKMLERGLPRVDLRGLAQQLNTALLTHNTGLFNAAVSTLLHGVPYQIAEEPLREHVYHGALYGVLRFLSSVTGSHVSSEESVLSGRPDIVIKLARTKATPPAVWIVELGVYKGDKTVGDKLNQAQQYAAAYETDELLVCALVVEKNGSASQSKGGVVVHMEWRRRVRVDGTTTTWVPVAAALPRAAPVATH